MLKLRNKKNIHTYQNHISSTFSFDIYTKFYDLQWQKFPGPSHLMGGITLYICMQYVIALVVFVIFCQTKTSARFYGQYVINCKVLTIVATKSFIHFFFRPVATNLTCSKAWNNRRLQLSCQNHKPHFKVLLEHLTKIRAF